MLKCKITFKNTLKGLPFSKYPQMFTFLGKEKQKLVTLHMKFRRSRKKELMTFGLNKGCEKTFTTVAESEQKCV